MSQYPSPYQQPQYPQYGGYGGGDPYAPLRSPAKRAGILMFILGGLLCLCGACMFVAGPMLENASLDPQARAQFNQIESDSGIDLKTAFIILGSLGIVPGILLIVLGVFVRGGGMGAVVTAIVVTGFAALGGLFFILSGLVGLANNPGPDMLLGLAMFTVPFVMLVLLLFWLIQAARNAGQIGTMQAQYQSQYWQYQQQQQAYQQQPPSQQGWPPPPPPPSAGDSGSPRP